MVDTQAAYSQRHFQFPPVQPIYTGQQVGRLASSHSNYGSIQVSGDGPALPSLRPNPNPKAAPTQTLGLREGRVGTSPETWINPQLLCVWTQNIMNPNFPCWKSCREQTCQESESIANTNPTCGSLSTLLTTQHPWHPQRIDCSLKYIFVMCRYIWIICLCSYTEY